jgi:glucose/arabinose dehydrogenase
MLSRRRTQSAGGVYDGNAILHCSCPCHLVHGVFWYDGWLWFTESGAIFKARDTTGDAFVAYHGSWNREKKAGYCVTRVLFDQGHPYGELVYVNFLTKEGRVLGRPVDVVVALNGSLLVSDDESGRIYRLSYQGR